MQRARVTVQRLSDVPAGVQRFNHQTLDWRQLNPRWVIDSGVGGSRVEVRQPTAEFQHSRVTVSPDHSNPGGVAIKLETNQLPTGGPARPSRCTRQRQRPGRYNADPRGRH